MKATLRKQLKSINKYNKIERNNYNLKPELGHLLRMVHTWICITTMTEHPEGRRKEDRSKTTVRKSTDQEQLQLWWNNWASAAARGRGRWRECIKAKILFCYFIILFRACASTKFSERYIFFCRATFLDKRKKLLILSKYLRKWFISFHILIKRNFMDIFTKKFVWISS